LLFVAIQGHGRETSLHSRGGAESFHHSRNFGTGRGIQDGLAIHAQSGGKVKPELGP
jgi:hypothetical protein